MILSDVKEPNDDSALWPYWQCELFGLIPTTGKTWGEANRIAQNIQDAVLILLRYFLISENDFLISKIWFFDIKNM